MSLALLFQTPESVSRLPIQHQQLVNEIAEAVAMENIPDPSPYEMKDLLEIRFRNNGIITPREFFSEIEKNDSLEMWTDDFMYLFAMGMLLQKSSYTKEQLVSIPWSQLFERAEFVEKQTVKRVMEALKTNQTQYNVTDWHLVKERQSALTLSTTVKIKQFTPFTSTHGARGVFALVKSRQPSNA